MDGDRWRPLRARKGDKAKQYDALVGGVPGWLQQALVEWLDDNFLLGAEDHMLERRPPRAEAIEAIQVHVRVEDLDWERGADSAHESLIDKCRAEADLFLSVLDFALLIIGRGEEHQIPIEHLERLLERGGSAWMVAPDRRGVVERVVPEAAKAAQGAIDSGGRAGQYLAEAWRHAYGRNPHPGTAYREAVRAIEAVVCPVVLPKDPKATLGKVIKALKDAPAGKFASVFSDTPPGIAPLDAVRGLMELVWTNELDRHGTSDEEVPLHVSQEQAEAALHAAVTLVQWFLRGAVRRPAGDAPG